MYIPNLAFHSAIEKTPSNFGYAHLEKWQWFDLPVGDSIEVLFSLMLVNYILCTGCIWQGLLRCFRNPNSTILSKRQSYFLVAGFEVMVTISLFLGYNPTYRGN